MAIVEMKKLTLIGVKTERSKILKTMQRLSSVQVVEHDDESLKGYITHDSKQFDQCDAQLAKLKWAIDQISKHDTGKKSKTQVMLDVNEIDAVMAKQDEVEKIVETLEALEAQLGELRSRETRLNSARIQLMPWIELKLPLERIKDTKNTVVSLYSVPAKEYDALLKGFAMMQVVPIVHEVTRNHDGVHILTICHVVQQAEFNSLLKESGALKVHFTEINGTANENLKRMQAEILQLDELRKSVARHQASHLNQLSLLYKLYDAKAMERERLETEMRFANTGSAFLLTGWVPANRVESLLKRIREVSPSCAVEIANPTDDDTPPTLLQNNKFVEPFEAVIDMYDTPAYRGFDPTFIMMPFFACYFGFMVSDAGYGLLLAIVATFAMIKFKPKGGARKLGWVLAAGGVATVFWGLVFGSVFSFNPGFMLISPADDALEMMVLCLGLGAIHILTGMGIAAYMNIRRGKPLDALYDQGLWVILLIGLPLMAVPSLASVGKIMSLIGFVGILLTAKRSNPNFFGRILGGLGALYGVTSYLGDILSYTRLFGMGLATGIIGSVINILVGMMMSSGPIGMVFGVIIFIGGNIFNFGINALGAYVHSCRLQYIEFFGKFFEGDGIPFKPLTSTPRYVSLQDSTKQS